MLLLFVTDGSVAYMGFQANYTTEDAREFLHVMAF